MAAEVVQYLAPGAGVYADLTLGLGGHAERVLESAAEARLIGIDRDPEALELARDRLARFGDRVTYLHGRFSELDRLLREGRVEQLDGLHADLGASYYQLTSPDRGFSFQRDCRLEMRMDRRSGGPTAEEIVNRLAEREISELIYTLGEERRARRVASSVVRARPIRSSAHLAEVIGGAVPGPWRHAVLQRVFMALRMAVNEELEELEAMLVAAPGWVRPGGRIVVISFHSLEDRIVKHAFQRLAREGRSRVLTKKVVRPGSEELSRNPPSRSAKLRAAEMDSGETRTS
jgi:16S rRNA (cytosine1402-N4)-methyltransferase